MSNAFAPAAAAFLRSALSEEGDFESTEAALSWLKATPAQRPLVVTQIPFQRLGEWTFEDGSGDLVHRSGKFFRVTGVHVESAFATTPQWDQPIIDQPEIGILGIITREVDGIVYMLMQAKMEPGNPLGVQLVPTVQATRSNYTQVHKGTRPLYLDYFLDRDHSNVLIDELQWEQGSAFLRKRNRNMVVAVDQEVPVEDGFRWLTIGQVKKLLAHANLVSMDTRSVVACIPLAIARGEEKMSGIATVGAPFGARVLASYASTTAGQSDDEVLSWLTEIKNRHPLTVNNVGLSRIRGWQRTDREIKHFDGRFFKVIAVKVESVSREVAHWSQPIVASVSQGLIALLVTPIDGVLHALVKARAEPGSADTVIVGPTVQRALDLQSGSQDAGEDAFLDLVASASDHELRYSCVQSEEGGRFFRVENLYRIVEIENGEQISVPHGYMWVTFRQLQDLLRQGLLSVEARSLLSCLALT